MNIAVYLIVEYTEENFSKSRKSTHRMWVVVVYNDFKLSRSFKNSMYITFLGLRKLYPKMHHSNIKLRVLGIWKC